MEGFNWFALVDGFSLQVAYLKVKELSCDVYNYEHFKLRSHYIGVVGIEKKHI